MKELIITSKKYGKHVVLYDDEDHELISNYTWSLWKSKRHKTSYCHAKVNTNGVIINIQMHRIIMRIENDISINIDHKDHNGLNNQKSNLRVCTQSQNYGNKNIYSCNTSGFKGVHLNNKSKKWVSRISINNKRVVLGTFVSVNNAAKAYNDAAVKYFGEFARLNHIPNE